MAVQYTEEAKFPLLGLGSGSWDAVINAALTDMDKGLRLTVIANEPIQEGEVVGLIGNSRIQLAQADTLNTLPAIGICLDTLDTDEEGQVLFIGWYDYDIVSPSLSASAGDVLYVADEAGCLTITPPTNVQVFGYVKSDTLSGITRIIIFPEFLLRPQERHIIQTAVEDLADGADIASRPVFVNPSSRIIELISVGILSIGTPSISPSSSCLITLKDDSGNTIITKEFTDDFPDKDFADLGSLDSTYKVLNQYEHVNLDVVNQNGTDIPAFLLILCYKMN